MAFEVLLHPKAAKALAELASKDRKRVKAALVRLQGDPVTKRPGADIKRLTGTRGRHDLFRIRIGGFRAVYAVQGDEVLITDIFPRGRGYDV